MTREWVMSRALDLKALERFLSSLNSIDFLKGFKFVNFLNILNSIKLLNFINSLNPTIFLKFFKFKNSIKPLNLQILKACLKKAQHA